MLWVLTAFPAAGCRRQEFDETPDGVVREWVERMSRMHGRPLDAERAYELLSQEAQANLQQRANRATAAAGRKMQPYEMLVPSRFSLRFTPQTWQARIAGKRAVVLVTGAEPQGQRAEVPCVLENDRWRVDLMLPPLAEIEKRPAPPAP